MAWSSAAASTPPSRATCSPSTTTTSPRSGQAYSGYLGALQLRPPWSARATGKSDSDPHSFDVHGSQDGHEREFAGGLCRAPTSTSPSTPSSVSRTTASWGLRTRAAFVPARVCPNRALHSRGNVLAHDDFDEAMKLRGGRRQPVWTRIGPAPQPAPAGNRYDVDYYSTELATGDFDRDGRTDVFVANGTAWFYSSAGIRPWQYLRASNKRIGQLGPRRHRQRRPHRRALPRPERRSRLRSRAAPPLRLTPLTSVPVPIKDLRFGDFDGDGLTDMFYTRQEPVAGLVRQHARLDSDADPGEADLETCCSASSTGCAAPTWSGSSGVAGRTRAASTQGWARLNGRLTSSFSNAVAADFDGNGTTDIAIGDGQTWRYSRDGNSPSRHDAKRRQPCPLPRRSTVCSIGRFDGGRRDQVISFSLTAEAPRLQYPLPAGRVARHRARPHCASNFTARSAQTMR